MKTLGLLLACGLLGTVSASCSDDSGGKARGDGGPSAAADGGELPPGTDGGTAHGKKFDVAGGPCHAFGPSRAQLGAKLEMVFTDPTVDYMVSTDTGIYFDGRSLTAGASTGGIYRLAPGATSATLVAPGGQPGHSGLVAGGGHVAWAGSYDDQPGVWTIPQGVDHATPVKALDADEKIWEVAVDADHAYSWNFFEGDIMSAPLTGGSAKMLSNGDGVFGMISDGGFLYVGGGSTSVFSGDSIWRMPVAGGTAEGQVTAPDYVTKFALDADAFYFSGDSAIYRQKRSDPSSQKAILQHSIEVSNDPVVSVQQIVLQGDTLFYVDRLNDIGWVRTDGSDCGFVATAFSEPNGYNVTIGASADAVYISDLDSRVLYRVKRSAL